MNAHLRFFASVAQSAGVHETSVTVEPGMTVGRLREVLNERFGEDFARQLAISAVMVNGVHAEDSFTLEASEDNSIRADILPPFAGG